MEWTARAQQILEKIRRYRSDEDGWKIAKKSVSETQVFDCGRNTFPASKDPAMSHLLRDARTCRR
jgi:hypothetical protein